ncbi:MAG: (d)CMP kinase [Bdellovibrionota bacterium]
MAVDGPAASGKSSLCAEVCQRIGWTYINTGALYRAIGYLASEKDIDVLDKRAMVALVEEFSKNFSWMSETQSLIYKDKDITNELYSEIAGQNASKIAKCAVLREILLKVQRDLAMRAEGGVIVDGRDIGSVVFPNADLKIYLTASLDVRAKRRFEQLKAKHDLADCPNYDSIVSEIAARDERDLNRETAPLVKASDAILVDTSGLSFQESIDALISLIKEHIPIG